VFEIPLRFLANLNIDLCDLVLDLPAARYEAAGEPDHKGQMQNPYFLLPRFFD
jgi:hypothetical protein